LARFVRHDRLCGSEASNRYAIGRTAHVIQTDRIAELDRRRLTAMFPADAEFELRPRRASFLGGNLHQGADALLVQYLKWIGLQDSARDVIHDELAGVISRKSKSHLSQIVGSE